MLVLFDALLREAGIKPEVLARAAIFEGDAFPIAVDSFEGSQRSVCSAVLPGLCANQLHPASDGRDGRRSFKTSIIPMPSRDGPHISERTRLRMPTLSVWSLSTFKAGVPYMLLII